MFGEVTTNGPDAALTLKEIVLKFIPPPPAALSLAVRRKLKLLVYVGKISPIVEVLLSKSDSLGKVLVDDTTGENDLKIGAFPEGAVGAPAGPRSNSSQQYVNVPGVSVSVAEPVKANGVLIGIVKPPAGTVTVGGVLPVLVVTGQVFPCPV